MLPKTYPGKRSSSLIKVEKANSKQLRDYGLIMGAAVAVLFSLYPWLILKKGFTVWPWYIVSTFWALSIVCPKILGPLYVVWMKLGNILGKINSTILLTLCFWVLFVPVALIFRLSKRDRLHRFNLLKQKSFRQFRENPKQVSQMELPF